MSRTGKPRRKLELSTKLNILTLIAFSALIFWCIVLMRNTMLDTAREMGTSLARSYAEEEQSRISFYGLLMELGNEYLDELAEEDADTEEIQIWLRDYFENLAAVFRTEVIDPFAVIDGMIVAADPWEGDAAYDYENTEWYRRATEAEGQVVLTDVYTDAITGRSLITIAQKSAQSGNILAFDIFLENFHVQENRTMLAQNSSYFLYDGAGELIYYTGAMDLEAEEARDYTERLYAGIQDGSLGEAAPVRDVDGQNRAVYVCSMDNGWMSVITVPMNQILIGDADGVLFALTAIFLVLFLTMVVVVARNHLGERKLKRVSDTIRILSDSYYAIYRIDYEAGTYESVKSSADVAEQVGKGGNYEVLLEVMKSLVDESTYQMFAEGFSLENIRRLVRERIPDFGGDYMRRFGDEYRWVNARIIYDKTLDLPEVILCLREVDGEKRRQLQQFELLEAALESAKKSVRDKSMFFSSVSHDMRTPLNAVIGLAELARRNREDRQRVDEYVEKIERSGKQLLTLINDILDMSRIEQGGENSLDYRPMDLRQCVEDCAGMFAEQAKAEGKTLTVRCGDGGFQVYGDPFRMAQVLNNLISNAIKYSGQGDSVRVELDRLERQGTHGKYRIVVADTGIGMSEAFLDRLFEPFTRETMFTSQKIVGTGLGMPIVKSLIQQMDGEIAVESALGKGSAFTVILPFQTVSQEAVPEGGSDLGQGAVLSQQAALGQGSALVQGAVSGQRAVLGQGSALVQGAVLSQQAVWGQEAAAPQGPAGGSKPAEGEEISLEGRTVLLAEDNEINMEIAAEALQMAGVTVIRAWNGKEAAERFAQSEPGTIDAVLMDMQMPEMDGCTASRVIRAMDRPDAVRVPIIAVTANAFAEDIARTTEAGMNAHISKPLDLQALCRLLAASIGAAPKG